jgi:hypothetical protein
MTEIWVYKADGTINCIPASETEISLADMRSELEALIGARNVLAEEKRGPVGPVLDRCGIPTGNRNAYKITPEGLSLLFSGVAGPSGFEVDPDTRIVINPSDPVSPWPLERAGDDPVPWPMKKGKEGDDFVPWPWVVLHQKDAEAAERAFSNVLAALTQVGSAPTQISELIGRKCRVYNEGDMYTLDYLPQRVNIVLRDARISKVWFG